MSAPNGFLLVHQIKELIREWEDDCLLRRQVDEVEADMLQSCIDDLKGIMPPEEEG